MKKFLLSDKALGIILTTIIILWLTAQFAVIFTVWNIPQFSDAANYQRLAETSMASGSIYPLKEMIENYSPGSGFPTYICYPGFINLLQFYLYIFGTWKAAFFFNVAFNCITAWSIFKIAEHLCGLRFAKIALCLYCLYPLPVLMVGMTMSEIPCIALTYLSLVWACHRKYGMIAASALLMVVAAYIRTVAILFAAGLLVYMIFKKYGVRLMLTYMGTAATAYLAIVTFNYVNTGYGFFSSTTMGVNMLIGANDDCQGLYNDASSTDSVIDHQLPGKTVFQIDSIQKAYAVEWIKRNPDKWSALVLPKLKYEMMADTFSDMGRRPGDVWTSDSYAAKGLRIFIKAFAWSYHCLLLILALFGLWMRRKTLWGVDGAILLPFILSLGLAVLTVGHPRYNMPYFPILIYFAVWGLGFLKFKIKN